MATRTLNNTFRPDELAAPAGLRRAVDVLRPVDRPRAGTPAESGDAVSNAPAAPRILALDPATKTGWAHSHGPAFSGTWDLAVKRDESSGMRLIRLRNKLNEIYTAVGVDVVFYEAARHGAPQMQGALVVQAELQGIIKAWCLDKGIEFKGLSPKEVKKRATGKGNANKDAVMAAAAREFPGITLVDDNHADALWILKLATETVG